jgi:hypothetical protein
VTTTQTVRIEPDGIYDDRLLYAALAVSVAALARARRQGKLRYTRQGKRILYLGEWVLSWLKADAHRIGSDGAPAATLVPRAEEEL